MLRSRSFFILHLTAQVVYLLGLGGTGRSLLLGNHSAIRLRVVIEARGNQGDAEGLTEAFVGAITPDDVGVVATSVLGNFEDLVHFVKRDLVGARGDIKQNVLRTFNVRVVEQGRVDGILNGLLGTVLAFGDTRAHDGLAAVLHDSLHVLEVNVDITRDGDDFRDASCSRSQHVISLLKGL